MSNYGINKYIIKAKKLNGKYEPLSYIYATSWTDAKQEFRSFLMEMLEDVSHDSAQENYKELCESKMYSIDTYTTYKDVTYTIRRVPL